MSRWLRRPPDTGCARAARCGLLLLLACQVFLSGCAKTGDPHPPIVLVPKAAGDLTARQYADKIILTVSVPVQNTNGSPVTNLGAVEVWRRTEDRAKPGAPLGEDQFLERAEKIMTVPGEKVAGLRQGKSLVLGDALVLADRSQIYAEAFRYSVRFLNRKKQNAGLSNQVTVAPVPIPRAPGDITAEITQDFIRLRWTAPTENLDGSIPARIAGYNVYRTGDPRSFPEEPLNQSPVPKPEFDDRSFEFDRTYFYAVSVVGSRENPFAESQASAPLQVASRDTFPPGTPANLNAVEAGTAVMLLWGSPPERDVAGYRVYRREEGEPAPRLLQQELVKEMSYRDETVRPGRKYTYRVTAVDTHGNEGPAAETVQGVR